MSGIYKLNRSIFLTGVLFALASAAFPALSHAFAKVLTAHYHPVAVVFFRSFVSLVLLSGWAVATKNTTIYKTTKIKSNILRGALGASSVLVIIYAYSTLPVGDVAALLNAAPLMSVLLALFFLGEKIGWKRAGILAIGFGGVILMAQPSGKIPVYGLAIGLSAAFGIAVVTVLIRHLGKTESPLTMTFYFSVIGTVAAGLLTPFFWTGFSVSLIPLTILCGFFGLLAQLSHAEALKRLPVAVKEPIGYTFFLWSLFLGLAIWGTIPTPIVLAGSGLVIGSNLLLVFIEYRKSRKTQPEAELVIPS
jgi:drug/metabolite transporter (DMT)-like permease